MKKNHLVIIIKLMIVLFTIVLFNKHLLAQNKSTKKYQALLWEISGNGLKSKSYLYGTMHVSKKLAFNLSDSFYIAIKSVDKIGLELNPDTWQDEMIKAENEKLIIQKYTSPVYKSVINSSSLEIEKYESNLQLLLKAQPSIINSLLYRNYNKYNEDYEEDTFLDLYIYQTGKKLGKKATGMERLKNSDIIQVEAYRDQLTEKKIAKDIGNSSKLRDKIEEAYRNQDLDELDSLEKVAQESEAFIKRFIIYRNVIQANSMDTVMKSGSSLFVGVGAAHLPGEMGVIELLRKKGYKLRPIKMAERDTKQKEEIEKLKSEITFKEYKNPDGLFEVKLPGEPYEMGAVKMLDTKQYSDMANGSYYLISRLRTHAMLMGDDETVVLEKVDSLLYENIPGKIIEKKKIIINGFDGFEITNKTRRGDVQRCKIIVLPNEIIMFKISGPNDYILKGNEANTFLNSIKINVNFSSTHFQNIKPKNAGFEISMPHTPIEYLNKNTKENIDRWEYETIDKNTNTSYALWRSNRNSYYDIKPDSFELELMNLSVYHSENVAYIISKSFYKHQGNSAISVFYKLNDSSVLHTNHIISASNYYTLLMHSTNLNSDKNTSFIQSFKLLPITYNQLYNYTDNIYKLNMVTPIMPLMDTAFRRVYNELSFVKNNYVNGVEKLQYWQSKKNLKLINDTTGEIVYVQTQQLPQYFYEKEMSKFWAHEIASYYDSTTQILIYKRPYSLKDGTLGYNIAYTDTGSSRIVKVHYTLKGRTLIYAITLSSNNNAESELIDTTFYSIKTNITKTTENILENQLPKYFNDFYSIDEKTKNKARQWISNIRYDEQGIIPLYQAFKNYKYTDKDFYENKTKLIKEFGYITDTAAQKKLLATLNLLYEQTTDSAMFQNEVYIALAKLRNKAAYAELKKIMIADPPIFDGNGQMNELFGLITDSVKAARVLMPDILQLSAMEDYRPYINDLLELMLDSNLIKPTDYESYLSKLIFDTKIDYKKQLSKDEEMLKKRNDKDAQIANRYSRFYNDEDITKDIAKDFKLIAPFYETNITVKRFFDKVFRSPNQLVVLSAVVALAKYGVKINDTLLGKLASNKLYAFELYKKLGEAKSEKIFPKQYLNHQHITLSQVYYDGGFKLLDTIVFIETQKVKIKSIVGLAYVYKYKLDADGPWYLALCGIQPYETNNCNFNGLVSDVKTQIDATKSMRKQIDKAIAKQVLQYTKNTNRFFGNTATNYGWE